MRNRSRGFTMMELVMVITILGIIAAMTVSFLTGRSDTERWEDTRAKLDEIRRSIVGDRAVTSPTDQARFGYLGDYGRMPTSLLVLTGPENPAWALDTFYGVGAGWRGPYYRPLFTGQYPVSQDEWGRNLVYSTTALSSLGSDGAVGGNSHATDITVSFPPTERMATVRGRLAEGASALSSQVVRVVYPANGTLIGLLTTTDANGVFLFHTVPYGQRALFVTSLAGGGLGPIPFEVNSPQVVLNPDLSNQGGRTAVLYNSGSVTLTTTPLSINKGIDTNATSNNSTITMGYTVPTNVGSDLALVVGISAEDNNTNVFPTGATFGPTAMAVVTTNYTGFSFNGYSAGAGMYIVAVTAGEKGTITGTFAGKNDLRGIAAATLAEIETVEPENSASYKNQDGETSGIFNTQSDGAMVVTYGHTGNQGTWTAQGTGHTILQQQNIGGQDSSTVMGYLLKSTAGTIVPLGFSHTNPNRMIVLAGAFRTRAGRVAVTLTSTYRSDRTLDYITVRWSNSAVLRRLCLESNCETVSRVPSGTRLKVNTAMTITAGATTADLNFLFSSAMSATDFVVTFEWTSGDRDTIRFTTP